MSRTYAIPDLHGRHDLLAAALAALEARAPGTVVFLGDYVDRGHESRAVIERLMAGPPPGWTWVCLQGNHEAMMVECLRDPIQLPWWLGNGGGQTLVSYGHSATGPVDVAVVPAAHVDWLAALPLLHVDVHRIFVHAGINRYAPLERQRPQFLQWHRYPARRERPTFGRHVVHGHDADPEGPRTIGHRTNLDVEAWRTGRLAVGVFDDDVPGGPAEIIEVGRG